MTETTYVDYRRWAMQTEVWPRNLNGRGTADDIEEEVIEDMTAQHLASAYRKLQRWCLTGSVPTGGGAMPSWNNVRKWPLARALLSAIAGETVVYEFDLTAAEARAASAKEKLDRSEKALVTERNAHRLATSNYTAAKESLDCLEEELAAFKQASTVLGAAGVTIIINAKGSND